MEDNTTIMSIVFDCFDLLGNKLTSHEKIELMAAVGTEDYNGILDRHLEKYKPLMKMLESVKEIKPK